MNPIRMDSINPDQELPGGSGGFNPIVASGLSTLGGIVGSFMDRNAAKKEAARQRRYNERMLDEQNLYNSPLQQRLRMEEAGYNPNLFYGQGNPGNQSTSLSDPGAKPQDHSFMRDIGPGLISAALAHSQILTQSVARDRSVAQTELAQAQKRVTEANPYLNAEAFNAMIDSLKSAAMLKANEATKSFYETQVLTGARPQDPTKMTVGQQIVLKELELLEQRFNLGGADLKLKAQVFESKEFQNAILEVQKKFLTSGDVSPGQFLQFISMLIMKAM